MHARIVPGLTELVHVHRRDNRLRQPDTFTLSEQVKIRVIGKRPLAFRHPHFGIDYRLLCALQRTFLLLKEI